MTGAGPSRGATAGLAGRGVDVVLRMRHDDLPAARRCLASLFASPNRTPFDVIVVACAGGGAEADALERERDARLTILRSTQPSDDQAALDRALALHRARDVVLLDRDFAVHGDWLDRLAFHARGEAIGAVGTFANAGGTAYPRSDAANAIPDGYTGATLDACFAQVNRHRSAVVDAASGPCRYVTRASMDALGGAPVGADDDADAERDWSRRASSAGFRCLVAGDVFVDCSDAPARRANSPHPGASASLALARRVDLARLAASPLPTVVFVAHGWGGGIRRHMNDLSRLAREHAHVLYLEPANDGAVKLHWPRDGESFAAYFRLPEDLPVLAGMLRVIGVARLHFHHVHGLPQAILDLPRTAGIAYDCTLHDYFAICPQYHLVDRQGRYCGEPAAAGCAACLAARPPQWPLDIAAWRETFAEFLRGAERVIAPSRDVETRIHRYFPALPIAVWPHPEVAPKALPPPIRVVTLGNLSNEKGLRVVAECASDAKRRALPLAFRVLGATAEPIAQAPDVPLTIHGSYADDDLPALLAAERADVLFFPAQVPETYAYTLSVALATDTPIVASAIGALPERLAGRPRVRLLPFDAQASVWNDAMIDVARDTASPMPGTPPISTALHAAP
jgi:glycosyltransferase involved in cell wall biosynthesis